MVFTIDQIGVTANAEPQPWVIDGVIPENGLTLIYGPPKVGKSFLAIDLALSAATARDWKGHSVGDDSWPVVYVAAEGASDVKAQRMPAWLHHRQVTPSNWIYVVNEPVFLLNPAIVDDFIEEMESLLNPPFVIVLDTLSRCFAFGNENDPKHMTMAVNALDRIRRELQTAIVVVHHSGKDVGKGARGSNVLEAAADAVFSVTSRRGGLILRNESQRFREPLQPISLDLVKVTNGQVSSLVVADEMAAQVIPRRDASSGLVRQQQALEVLRDLGRARPKDWAKAANLLGGTFDRVRSALEEQGLITKDGAEYVVLPDQPSAA